MMPHCFRELFSKINPTVRASCLAILGFTALAGLPGTEQQSAHAASWLLQVNAPQEATTSKNLNSDEVEATQAISKLLGTQVDCWNRFDLDGFMMTYWKSPELTFSSGGETTRGWQATLDRYKSRYSTPEKMGYLTFSDLEITLVSSNAALVLGKWHLKRDADELKGNFSLVLKKIEQEWKIIHDHSSSLDEN